MRTGHSLTTMSTYSSLSASIHLHLVFLLHAVRSENLPVSRAQALEDGFSLLGAKRRIAVIADMLELGPDAPKMHREVGEFAASLPIDLFVTVGDAMKEADAALAAAGKTILHADNAEKAASLVCELAAAGDAVLLKGSHSMGLSAVREALSSALSQ